MPRLTLTRAEWLAVAEALADPHRGPAPPGLEERVCALLRGVPASRPDQAATLVLDPRSTAAVVAVLAALAGRHPAPGERAAAVVAAEAIVRAHQRKRDG